jgi:hypothetical protein
MSKSADVLLLLRPRTVLMIAAAAATAAACGGGSSGDSTGPALRVLTSLSISPSSVTISTIAPGNTVRLAVTPLDQFNVALSGLGGASFSTSDGSVATVNATGDVSALLDGITGITASLTSGGVTKTVQATVMVDTDLIASLVGTWNGSVAGTPGSASLTMVLGPDYHMSTSSDAVGYYVPLVGTWSVSGIQFRAAATEPLAVIFTGIFAGNALVGTWVAPNGNGSFSLTR